MVPYDQANASETVIAVAAASSTLFQPTYHIIHRTAGIFKQPKHNLRQVAQFASVVDDIRSFVGHGRTDVFLASKSQDIDHRVEMRFGREVQTRSDASPHGVDGKIRRVIHVDHVPHVSLVVDACDVEIVLDLLQQGAANLDPHASLLVDTASVLLWHHAIRH